MITEQGRWQTENLALFSAVTVFTAFTSIDFEDPDILNYSVNSPG